MRHTWSNLVTHKAAFFCRLELYQTPVCSRYSLIITLSSLWCLSSLWFVWRLSLDGGAIQGEKATWQSPLFHSFEKRCWNTMMCMHVRKGVGNSPWKLSKLVCLNFKGFCQGYLTQSFHFSFQLTSFHLCPTEIHVHTGVHSYFTILET